MVNDNVHLEGQHIFYHMGVVVFSFPFSLPFTFCFTMKGQSDLETLIKLLFLFSTLIGHQNEGQPSNMLPALVLHLSN